MAGMEGELDGFDYGSKRGRTGFIAQEPLVVEGNRILIDPRLGGIITEILEGDGINITDNDGSVTIINDGVINIIEGDNITIDNSDPNHPVIINDGVVSVVAGTAIGVNNTDPNNPIVTNNGVRTLVQGANVTIDNTDPRNPIISASGSGTSGVDSWSGGTTGMTPAIATSGPVTMAGTLVEANGGTGETTYTNGQLLIGNNPGLSKGTLGTNPGLTTTLGAGSITLGSLGIGFRAGLTGDSNAISGNNHITAPTANWDVTLWGGAYSGTFSTANDATNGIYTVAVDGIYYVSYQAYANNDDGVTSLWINHTDGSTVAGYCLISDAGLAGNPAGNVAHNARGSAMWPITAGSTICLVNSRPSSTKTYSAEDELYGVGPMTVFTAWKVFDYPPS